MEFSMKDSLRASVEFASNGKNTVLYDEHNNPSIMVIIPRFKKEHIDPSLGTGTHEAFIVHGREVPEIFYPKYANIILDAGCPCSIPGVKPTTDITHAEAVDACKKKGRGWHLSNNAEWSAIALLSFKNKTLPHGNTNFGIYDKNVHETGVSVENTKYVGKYDNGGVELPVIIKSGTGPVTWSHDNTPSGVYDMVGNVWELVAGLKVIDGKIYVAGEDGVPMNNFDLVDVEKSTKWWIDTKAFYTESGGSFAIGTSKTSKTTVAGYFETIIAQSGYTIPDWMKSLCIFPYDTNTEYTSSYSVSLDGERLPMRGGCYHHAPNSSIFSMHITADRDSSAIGIGSRPVYIDY